jgi:hypothetical protein
MSREDGKPINSAKSSQMALSLQWTFGFNQNKNQTMHHFGTSKEHKVRAFLPHTKQ